MTYLTINAVAEELGYTIDQVHELLFVKLFPSVSFDNSVFACDPEEARKNKEPCKYESLSGHFKLTGTYRFTGRRGLKWDEKGEASLADMFLDRDGKVYTLYDVGTIRKKDLYISRDELDRYNKSIGWIGSGHPTSLDTASEAVKGTTDNKAADLDGNTSPNTGGRPPGQLREAIECLYLHLRKQGNTEILRAGKVKEFLPRLQKCKTGTDKVSEYISLRIDKVDLKNTKMTVRVIGNLNSKGTVTGSRYYDQDRVTQILSDLRKKYPLP